jgi:Domain of unknown function (DUF4173)
MDAVRAARGYGAGMTPDESGPALPGPTALDAQIPTDAAPDTPHPTATPLLLALGLGSAAHLLAHDTPGLGLNLGVWLVLLTGAVLWALRRRGERPDRAALALLLTAVAFGLSFTLRAPTPQLGALGTLALLTSLTLGLSFLRPAGSGFAGLRRAGPAHLLGALLSAGLRLAYGPLTLLARFPWQRLRPPTRQGPPGRAGRIALGLLLTAPVVLVFGALLAGADARFAQLGSAPLRWNLNLDGAFSWTVTLLVWCALAGGLLYPALLAARPSLLRVPAPATRLGLTETGLPLAALAALFVTFAALQLPALLGGRLPDGETYASFIRQGFTELMTVAFLTAGVLLGAHGLSAPRTRTSAGFRALTGAVLLPLTVILASAAQRWTLYTQAYGLSETRVLGAAFLVWITLTLAWLAWRLWRGDTDRFAFPALLGGLLTLLALTALNPAALIARVNIHRHLSGVTNDLRLTPQRVSAAELAQLGAGAVPDLVRHLDALTVPTCGPGAAPGCTERQDLINLLRDVYGRAPDWRSWNLAYARAFAAVQTLPPATPDSSSR